MTMPCREFRELIDSYLAEELLVETNHAMIRHLEGCALCRADVEERRQLRAGLQSAFATSDDLRVRPEFVAALTSELRARAETSSRRWTHVSGRWALAAGLVLAAAAIGGGSLWRVASERSALSRPEGLDEAVLKVARDAAGDHRDCALHFRLAERPISLDEAARRYDAAYAALRAAVRPTSANAGNVPVDIVEDHSCVFEGRRFAHIVLRYRGQLVSVLVAARENGWPRTSPGHGEAARLVASVHEVEGFHEASFEAPRHVVFVVSALDEADTLAVARTIADSMYQHLAGA